MSANPHFYTVAPTIPVSDLSTAIEYYVNILGFKIIFQNPGVFAVVGRDNVRIGLQEDSVGDKIGKGNCYIWTSQIRQVFEEFRLKGARFVQELGTTEEKVQDFVIEDLDGNTIGVGEA